MNPNFNKWFSWLLTWGFLVQGVVQAQVLVPASGNNTVLCGTNVTLCDAGGCTGNYPSNANGFTVLRATGSAVITISGTFNTETDADVLIVYDGIGIGGTQIFSGSGPGGTFNYTGAPGQSLTVRFFSDASVVAAGFNLTVTYSGTCGTETLMPTSGSLNIPCGTNAIVTDDGGPAGSYSNSANGFIVFNNSGIATLSITGPYVTEAGFDFIEVFDGVGTGGTLLQTVSGTGNLVFNSSPGQTVTLRFRSDGTVTAAGFEFSASYSGPCVCPTFSASATPATVCGSGTSQLNVTNVPVNAYTVSTIPFAPFSCTGGIAGPTGDDAVSPIITLPFTFFFYGTPFTQLGISTNGNIQLGAGPYNAAFTSSGPIPATNINNMIALNYADWMANGGGTISYQVQGTAPNRRFIVCYTNMRPFPTGTTGNLTGQIVLYEGSNIIDMYITDNNMPTYNTQTQGLQATNGTGVGVGGRNFTNWTATNSGIRFDPNANYSWSGSGLSSTTTQNPVATVTATTTYQLTTTYGGCTNVSSVTVSVEPLPSVTVTPSSTSLCTGQSTTLTASGANSYTWSTGATGSSITVSPSVSTNYTVTGLATNGCTATAVATVTAGPSVTVGNYSICQGATVPAGQGLTASATAPSNNATLTGSTAGQPTYNRVLPFAVGGTCALSGAGTAVNYFVHPFTPTTTGSYTITSCGTSPVNWDMFTTIYQNSFNPAAPCTNAVTAADDGGTGCSSGNTITLNLTAGVSYFIVNTSFSNGTTGAFQVTITAPPPPALVINWFTGPSGGTSLGTGSPFNPVGVAGSGLANTNTPGTYTFYADANGCRVPVNFVINSSPTPSISGNTAICPGNSTTLTASGGTSYAWNTGANTPSITVSPATTTTYTVTATGSNGCTASTTATVNVNANPTTTINGNLAICLGQSTSLSAGTVGSSYLWNTGATTSSITVTPLTNTTYSLSVVDASGCTATASATVTVNPLPSASISGTLSLCNGQSTTLTAAGGASYLWNTGATTAAITVSPATNTLYTVTLTSAAGCTSITATNVTVNPLPTASIAGNLEVCAGQSTTLTAAGGTGYLWNTGATTAAITVSPATNTAYLVTVTNANSCTASTSSTVTVNPLPTPSISGNLSICAGQSTTLTGSGGSSYAWNTGSTNNSITVNPGTTTTYTLTISDGTATSSATVYSENFNGTHGWTLNTSTGTNAAQNNFWVVNDNEGGVAPGGCGLANNGDATLHITSQLLPNAGAAYNAGGLCPILFCVTTSRRAESPAFSAVGFTNLVLSFDYISLGQGLTDNASVQYFDGTTWTTINPSIKSTVCGSGQGLWTTATINLPASANNNPNIRIGFNWTNDDDGAGSDPSVAINNVVVSGLGSAPGGCVATTSVTVTVNPLPTPSLSGNLSICPGQSTTLTAAGGTGYLWNTGATTTAITVSPAANTAYLVTVTNANGCTASTSSTVTVNPLPTPSLSGNLSICLGQSTTLTAAGGTGYLWNTGATTTAITVSPAANTAYLVTVTNANGCTASTSSTVTVNPLPTPSLSGGAVTVCPGQTVTLSASGGDSYAWSTGANTASITVNPTLTTDYTVTASSATGCTATASTTVTVSSSVSLTLNSTNISCNGGNNGAVTSSASGGTGTFSYLWSNGATTANLSNLSAGAYTLTLTDNLGGGSACPSIASVTLTEPSALSLTLLSSANLNCNGDNSGAINMQASGGTSPYSFVWSNGATNQNLNALPAGSYSLTMTDNNNCTASAGAFTLTEPSALSLSLVSVTNAGCGAGANQGSITVNVSGGTNPYTFAWSNGATSQNLSSLTTGSYTLNLSDNNGCTTTLNQTISSGGIALSLVSAVDSICFGANTGSLNIEANPAAGASFVWSTGATSQNLSDLVAGVYTVTASNVVAGVTCTDVLSLEILQPAAALTVAINQVQGLDCSGQSIGILEALPSGSWGTYSYNWSTGSNGARAENLAAASYTATVTDALGCVATNTASIAPVIIPVLDAWIGSSGQGQATVDVGQSIEINAGANQAGVSYTWSPATWLDAANAFSSNLVPQESGNFVYVIRAQAGACSAVDSVELTVTAGFKGLPNAFTPNGDGQNDRFRPIDLNPSYIRTFRVFNRWGQVVYDNAELSDGGWDGSFNGAAQPRDTYIYILEYQFPQDDKPRAERGEVTLLR